MNREHPFSDETLNAFVDSQLLTEEKERIYQGLEQDKELTQYVCRLRTVHDLIQDAYDPTTLPPQKTNSRRSVSWSHLCRAAAVILLFVAGGTVGWLGHAQLHNDPTAGALASAITGTAQTRGRSVLLHISNGDAEHISMALTEAERMLQRARDDGTPLQLEILANDSGLNLLRANNGEFSARVAELKRDYSNVDFMACAKALERLKDKGVDYKLVPQARVVPSALDEIVERMENGWIYIRV